MPTILLKFFRLVLFELALPEIHVSEFIINILFTMGIIVKIGFTVVRDFEEINLPGCKPAKLAAWEAATAIVF